MKTNVSHSDSQKAGKSEAVKQASTETILQAYKRGTSQLQTAEDEPIQQKENKTGLPDNLKTGVENLSGHSLDDVKVHYNSSQPATLQAHAYAQGSDIHVAPGQEKHLPHEAWHVVQQKQGRVKPTMQMKGTVPVNDDAGLEKEADVMGAKALTNKTIGPVLQAISAIRNNAVQLKTDVRIDNGDGTDTETSSKKINTPNQGLKWFRFSKSGNEIDSFSNNIYPLVPDKGDNPVTKSVEIGAQAEKEEAGSKEEIPNMSRAKHFGLGDRQAGITKESRKGKWTWHHQNGKYNMQLVDMFVHGGFGHTGGFSQWQEDDSDED
ncbi:hypothetical protein D3C71_406510 [compost metagenome]